MRALLFALMADGTSHIRDPLQSPDTTQMLRACEALGGRVTSDDPLTIVGVNGRPSAPSDVIDAGNSGILLRFVGALAALSDDYCILTGDASVRENRLVFPLIDGLRQFGAFADARKRGERAPIIIRGPLLGGHARISGRESQPVSALLIALSFLPGEHRLGVIDPGETPFIEVTLSWLRRFGARITHESYRHYEIEGNLRYPGFDYTVPGDFSSAAYPWAATRVTGSSITITNLDPSDSQGDKALLNGELQGEIDCNPFIDALPILAVLGCYGDGELRLRNAAIARQKECDRIATIAHQLRRMGADMTELPDGLVIRPAKLRGAIVSSCGDHRIALSLAVAAMGASGETLIENVACVDKTYQTFLQDMQNLGANIELDSDRPSGLREEHAGEGACREAGVALSGHRPAH